MTSGHEDALFDPIAVMRRRSWSLLLPLAAGGLVGVLLVKSLPREYVSTATLAVSMPSVSGDLARPTPQDLEERIRAISQELLSQEVVEQAARETGLLQGSSAQRVLADVRARTSVSLPVKTLAGGRVDPDTFLVSYVASSAAEAQRVTDRLLQVFVDRHTRLQQSRATQTATFLGDQLRVSQRRMDDAEARLRRYKEAHAGVLPEQALVNLQAMSDLRQRAESNAQAMRAERDRLAAVEQQVDLAHQEVASVPPSEEEQKANERVATLETQVTEARQQYTSKHPEVQRLEADLATAKNDSAQVRTAARAPRPPQKAEQLLQQLTAERDRLKEKIRELQGVDGRLPQELARYQARVDQAPVVEQELAPLAQAYEFEKEQNRRLAERHQAALLAEDLESRRAAGQFVVLYPASLPAVPTRPNVPLVLALALLAGAIVGLALAFTREYLDKSVHDVRTIQHEFDCVVLADIPNLRRKRA